MEELNKTVCNDSRSNSYDYTMYDEHIAGIYLWKILSPIMILLGTAGSIFSIIVLNKSSMRQSVCVVYLTALSVSDLIALNTGLLRNWIIWTFELDIREFSEMGCKIHSFLVYFSLDFSAWMLGMVTIVRASRVCTPTNILSSKQKASLITTFIGFLLVIINGNILFGFGDIEEKDSNTTVIRRCSYVSHGYRYFFLNTWPWIDFSIFCGVPSSVLLIGNVVIVYKVFKSSRNVALPQLNSSQQQQRSRAKMTSMTAMLLTLNTVFLLSTTPISIYFLFYENWYNNTSVHDWAILSLVWPIVNIFMYLNNTLNFGLYVLSGKSFRREAMKVLRRKNVLEQSDQRQIVRHIRRVQVAPIQ